MQTTVNVLIELVIEHFCSKDLPKEDRRQGEQAQEHGGNGEIAHKPAFAENQ